MSTKSLFDHQAQPFWDEAGTYFPPGFDPQTGQWIDPAYEEAYAQGFVWDAALQDWAPLDLASVEAHQDSADGEPVEIDEAEEIEVEEVDIDEADEVEEVDDIDVEAVEDVEAVDRGTGEARTKAADNPEGEWAIGAAIFQLLDRRADAVGQRDVGEDARQREALALETAAVAKRLLDAIARDADETTAIDSEGDREALELIFALLRQIAPREESGIVELRAEGHPTQVPLLGSADIAAAPRFAVLPEELERGSTPIANDLWELIEARDFSRQGTDEVRLATLIELPPLPFDEAQSDQAPAAFRLKNGLPLALGFDAEIDPEPHPVAGPYPPPAPNPARRSDLIRQIDRALDLLESAAPAQLEQSICVPLETASDEAGEDPNDREQALDTSSLWLSAAQLAVDFAPGSAPTQDPPPADAIAHALSALTDGGGRPAAPRTSLSSRVDTLEMPMVRLRRPDRLPTADAPELSTTGADGERAGLNLNALTIRMRRPSEVGNKRVEIDSGDDLPSDDIELALTALASFIQRQNTANSSRPAPPPPPAASPVASARKAVPPPLPARPAIPGKKPPPPLPRAPLSQQITPLLGVAPQPAEPKPQPPANVPVAIALNGTFRVVCRTLDGAVYRGILQHPNLTAPTLTLALQPGPSTLTLETRSLQAIFFLRRPGQGELVPEGRKARLLFKSGRQRSGLIPAFDPHGSGFFFYPSQTQGSPTEFWFVYGASLASIDFE